MLLSIVKNKIGKGISYDFIILISQYANKSYLFKIYISMCLCLSLYTRTFTYKHIHHPRESLGI